MFDIKTPSDAYRAFGKAIGEMVIERAALAEAFLDGLREVMCLSCGSPGPSERCHCENEE